MAKKLEIEVTSAEADQIRQAIQNGAPVRVAIGGPEERDPAGAAHRKVRRKNPNAPVSADARKLLAAARSSNPGVPLSADARKLLAAARSSNPGVPLSEDARKLLAAARSGNPSVPLSEDARKLLAAAAERGRARVGNPPAECLVLQSDGERALQVLHRAGIRASVSAAGTGENEHGMPAALGRVVSASSPDKVSAALKAAGLWCRRAGQGRVGNPRKAVDGVTVTSDHRFRPFKYRDEVPADVLQRQFDYLDEDEIDGFFQYKGTWYHLQDFMRLPEGELTSVGWQGYHGDSFFSGVVIAVSKDGETYKVGRYVV